MGVRYPLDRWWHMVETAPTEVTIRHDGDDVWRLRGDGGQPLGYMYGQRTAQWWETAHDLIPMLLVSLEEVLWQRDLLMSALMRRHPETAMEVGPAARVPMTTADWTPLVASAAASHLEWVAACEENGWDQDEPF